jgi:integrase
VTRRRAGCELVPLLQIAPSKTDQERLLLVSPELADVLSAIICRVRGQSGAISLLAAYDARERLWLAPAPLLFQRRVGSEHRAIGASAVRTMLTEALAHAGLTDPATGGPLHFTPHDFRRVFITEFHERAPAAHRPGHRRPPGHQRHDGL